MFLVVANEIGAAGGALNWTHTTISPVAAAFVIRHGGNQCDATIAIDNATLVPILRG
jgi:hypothetical protein